MKKIAFIFFMFLLFSLDAHASNWKFIWDDTTTTIEVPLGANLQNYIFTPKAALYRDDILLQDAEIHYVRTGDWLYLLTDVDTHKEGIYQVWYKATEHKYQPGQCQGYKTLVTFQVVDKQKPVIVECPTEVTYWIGTPLPDYETQIKATDNSDVCEIEVDTSLINFEVPGDYQAIARAKDRHHITEQSFIVHVKDPIGPVVTFLGENNRIVLAKGDSTNLISYFKAVDKIDGDVTDSISYPIFSTEEEKSFELEVTFSDKNHNSTSLTVWIDIVDRDEILIELYKSILILEYNKDVKKAIEDNIKRASLGKTNIKNEVQIDYGELMEQVGSYQIKYYYQKQDKSCEVLCEVKLLASKPPVLLVENIQTTLNNKVDILSHIQVQDPSDRDIIEKLEFDDSLVDYTQVGMYPVRISVINSSGLSSSETLYITVYENSTKGIEEAKSWNYVPFILLGIVGIGGIGFFIYLRKKRNCNKEQNQL